MAKSKRQIAISNGMKAYWKRRKHKEANKTNGGLIMEDKGKMAQILKELREKMGLSLQDVADRAGVSKAHLWELEVGRQLNPTLETVRRLAVFFKLRVSSLIGDTPISEDDTAIAMFSRLKQLNERDLQIVDALIKVLQETNEHRESIIHREEIQEAPE